MQQLLNRGYDSTGICSLVLKNNNKDDKQLTKEKKISIHNFIFNHYKDQTKNDPSSLAIFEKKIRSIAYSIKDEFIKKYVLEFFLDKISLLTPNANQNNKKRDKQLIKIKFSVYIFSLGHIFFTAFL